MPKYTASFAFFEALIEAGVSHVFVNLGSDHPSIMEAMISGKNRYGERFPHIITVPNEMVALSMADGFARVSGKPQAVIVHVDVGTQGLGAAVHNASTGRAPVLIFAGLSPVTIEGELRGSRTEFIHWIQDVPDQKQIVAQYCRYTGEIKTGVNVKQMVNRALSFAMSDPKGPVYLYGAREPLEQDIEQYSLNQSFWTPVQPTAIPEDGVKTITEALVNAKEPLLVTGYSGRNIDCPGELIKLANAVKGLRVLDTGGSDMCFPADHPSWLGLRYGADPSIETADVILVLDCDVPWINARCKPRPDAKIYHIDVDPLKQMMPVFYIDALARFKADSTTAIRQIINYINSTPTLSQALQTQEYIDRGNLLVRKHEDFLKELKAQGAPPTNGSISAAYLSNQLKKVCPEDTIWCIEAVTETLNVADQIQATLPGSWLNCGGGGLGWSGGGALGIKLASDLAGKKQFVCQIVGDGSFLFSVPGSVYWVARKYNIPVLTIVLNNKGWNAPKRSMLLVHPDGVGSKATNEELNISFDPTPDYSGIAKASAGGEGALWAVKTGSAKELLEILPQAVEKVQNGMPVVLDARLNETDVSSRLATT